MNILKEAEVLIYGDRNEQYGAPIDNHGTTGELWSAYLKAKFRRTGNLDLSPEDVCYLNVLQKVSREATTGAGKRDTIVDIAGYAGNVEMIRDERNDRKTNAETFGPLKGDQP